MKLSDKSMVIKSLLIFPHIHLSTLLFRKKKLRIRNNNRETDSISMVRSEKSKARIQPTYC